MFLPNCFKNVEKKFNKRNSYPYGHEVLIFAERKWIPVVSVTCLKSFRLIETQYFWHIRSFALLLRKKVTVSRWAACEFKKSREKQKKIQVFVHLKRKYFLNAQEPNMIRWSPHHFLHRPKIPPSSIRNKTWTFTNLFGSFIGLFWPSFGGSALLVHFREHSLGIILLFFSLKFVTWSGS